MSDARRRELEREVARGDSGARVRLLAERMRVGTLTRERVELAAYAGDAAAREVLRGTCPVYCSRAKPVTRLAHKADDKCIDNVPEDLEEWTRPLRWWGNPIISFRASVVGARLVLEGIDRGRIPLPQDTDVRHARRVIDAAERWIAKPTEARRRAWNALWLEASAPSWAPWPEDEEEGGAPGCRFRLRQASACVGEQPVREAVRAALTAWALA